MSGTYKPTGMRFLLHLRFMDHWLTRNVEHGGLKEDGTPDKRVGTGQFAQGQVDPHEAGKQGGQTGGSSSGGSSESTGSSGGNGRE